jgi:cytochrome oxidase Cu insertion factor (SCO1/SenC/PrrC family)
LARRRSLVALGAAALALAATFAIIVAFGSWRDGSVSYIGSQPPVAITLPQFALTDAISGREVSNRSLRGRVVALTFLDTACTDACPLIVPRMIDGLAALSRDERHRVALVALSVDPSVDTPAAVNTFLRRHRARGRLQYLIGNAATLRPIWKRFYVLSALETGSANSHSAPVRIYDGDGRWVSSLHLAVDLTPANLAHDVRLAGA